jgi:hypothetical protein
MTEQHRILIALEVGISIGSMTDISNAVASTFGAGGLILAEDDVCSEFFDLKTGLAGELFQKFENYELCLAIIVPSPERYGGNASANWRGNTNRTTEFASFAAKMRHWLGCAEDGKNVETDCFGKFHVGVAGCGGGRTSTYRAAAASGESAAG